MLAQYCVPSRIVRLQAQEFIAYFLSAQAEPEDLLAPFIARLQCSFTAGARRTTIEEIVHTTIGIAQRLADDRAGPQLGPDRRILLACRKFGTEQW